MNPLQMNLKGIKEFEEALNELRFDGVEMGGTISQLIYIEIYLGNSSSSLKARLATYLRTIKYRYLTPLSGNSEANISKSDIILTIQGDRPHYLNLILPLLSGFSQSEKTFITHTEAVQKKIPSDGHFLSFTDLPLLDYKKWKQDFGKVEKEWRRLFNEICAHFDLPAYLCEKAWSELVFQTMRIRMSELLLQQVQPKVIVTEMDRNYFVAPLVLKARDMGIKTFTLVHGVLNKGAAFVPLLADYVLCWGASQKDVFVDMGTEPGRVVVTGSSYYSRETSIKQSEAKSLLGLKDDPVMLLITNPIDMEHRLKLVDTFGESIRSCNAQGIVRLHPSETIDTYFSAASKFPDLVFHMPKDVPLEQSIASSDVLFVHDSGVGNEAIIKKKAVVVMDVLPVPLGNGDELINQAGCISVKDKDELTTCISSILNDPLFLDEARKKNEEYISKFCAAFGLDAAENVIREIKKHVELH